MFANKAVSVLLSPIHNVTQENCLKFYHNFRGHAVGELKVFTADAPRDALPLQISLNIIQQIAFIRPTVCTIQNYTYVHV